MSSVRSEDHAWQLQVTRDGWPRVTSNAWRLTHHSQSTPHLSWRVKSYKQWPWWGHHHDNLGRKLSVLFLCLFSVCCSSEKMKVSLKLAKMWRSSESDVVVLCNVPWSMCCTLITSTNSLSNYSHEITSPPQFTPVVRLNLQSALLRIRHLTCFVSYLLRILAILQSTLLIIIYGHISLEL